MSARRIRSIVAFFVAAVVILCVLMPGNVFRGIESGGAPVLLTFLVVIVIAEQFRLEIPGRLPTSATSAAAGMALAVTTRLPDELFLCSSAEVLITVAAGQLLGLLVRAWRGCASLGDSATAFDGATRLFSVALAATVAREMPIFGGRTLEIASYTWPGWLLASVLVVIGALTGVFEAPLRSAGRSIDGAGVSWRRFVSAEMRSAVPMGAALTATGALVALTVSVCGLIGIPLVLALLAMTDFGVSRYVQVQETYSQSVQALSRMPEELGFVAAGHGARVSELSRAIGRKMRLPEHDVELLTEAALVHDVGQLGLRRPLPRGATVQAATNDQQRIADDGAEVLRRGGPPMPLAEFVRHQAVPYHRVMSGQHDTPLEARIIKVANAFDDYGGRLDLTRVEECRVGLERIYLGLGYEYDPRVVDALTGVLREFHPATDVQI
ncbi:HD-GYP domain-containing protein [Austwickia chelonae]|uniref:HD-GYP domain-containing protein n=1 Tax=Austwickia chelonae TaxID=100225 RepID=UPI000E237258|nr:HD domain-containing protein [Austwickia chelonae]